MGKTARQMLLALGLVISACMAWPLLAANNTDFSIFRVGDLSLPAQAVVAGEYKSTEVASTSQIFFPAPSTNGWWRIEVHQDFAASARPMMYLNTITLTQSEVWLPGAEKPIVLSQLKPQNNLDFSPHMQVVALQNGLRAGQSIYWRVNTSAFAPLPISIQSEQSLRAYDLRQTRLQSTIEGIILAIVIAGLVLSIMLRETTFLVLAVGIFLSLLFVLSNNGDIFHVPLLAKWDEHFALQRIFGLAACIVTAYFTYIFLDMPRYTPRIAMVQKCCIAILILLFAVSLMPGIGASSIIPKTANSLIIITILTGLSSSIILMRMGNRFGKLFFWSWTPLFIFALWRVFEVSFKLPPNEYISILFPASYAVAGILLYSGLGERMLIYKRERDASERMARMDSLTDIYNRRALDERLRIAATSTEKNKQSLAVLFADIDHFKRINDTYGHAVGDEVLKTVAKRISGVLRFGDVFGRYGGEEFVIGLPDANQAQAQQLAERIRKSISDDLISFNEHKISITISIGIAVMHSGPDGIDAALQKADNALYFCKQNGRNCVNAAA